MISSPVNNTNDTNNYAAANPLPLVRIVLFLCEPVCAELL